MKLRYILFSALILIYAAASLSAATTIPSQAWSRDINAAGYKDGASIGGFGAGTVTWRLNGNFYKNRLNIGDGNDSGSAFTDDANAKFYLYQKPASSAASMRKLDAATLGSDQATYYSLFPKSWVDYTGSQFTVKAKVTQFSPIIPNDYQRVSYPVGIYEWELTNPTGENVDTAIMLTWQNNYSGLSATAVSSGNYRGIVLHWSGTGPPTAENQGEFCLGTEASAGVTVSYLSTAALAALETDFSADGTLANSTGNNTLGGIAFKVTLAPGATVRIPIVLSWDIAQFQMGPTGYRWWREYTRYFGRTGRNAWGIALEALTNHASWESQVDAWQSSVLTNATYPTWLKSMLFNELYIYFTAGTVWEAGAASGQADDANEDMFSHLESYIYDFYGTSDVRFYGSWALFLNWPDIDKQAIKQFADSVYHTRPDRPPYLNTTAHDVGGTGNTTDTAGEPVFQLYNAYTWRDSTNWKDLNSKLVLMVYRDWVLTGSTDTAFLNYCWEPVRRAMLKVKSQDADADGLPDSSGIDQTYDDMDLTGDTSYCGSLFLAACQAAKGIADALGNTAQGNVYQAWYDLAQPNFESQLWNGTYYNIDTGSFATNRIMSDQLSGHWYSKALNLGGIVTDAHAVSAWQKVYDNNFLAFGGGANGVCNVMNAAGTIDTSSPQTQESWVGTSWGVVSGMVQQGMTAQANAIGQSLYNAIWNSSGQYWFRTPEAWRVNFTGSRAYYYMRGTTVWAAKRAYDIIPVAGTPTNTPTRTRTRTPTPYYSPTISPTNTPYVSPTFTGTRTASPTFTQTPLFAPIRVNCAGAQYTDTASNIWLADRAYVAGSWGNNGGGTTNLVADAIAGTLDDDLYRAERWGACGYLFTVPNGTYSVTLKFAELWFGIAGRGGTATGAGSRSFNVTMEGVQVLTAFDVFAAAGGADTAVDRVFTVTVTDGILNINFVAGSADNPTIEAIEVIRIDGTATITPSSSITATPTHSRTNTPFYSSTITRTYTITPTYSVTPVIPPDIIDDIEDGDDTIAMTAGRNGKWFTFNDGSCTQTLAFNSAGHAGNYSAHITNGACTSYSGFGFNFMAPEAAYDAAAYDGIQFWVRLDAGSDNYLRVNVTDANTRADYDYFGIQLTTLTTSWQQFIIPFSSLTQTGSGTAYPALDEARVYSVEFRADPGYTFAASFDDIKFYYVNSPTFTRTATITPVVTATLTPVVTSTLTRTPSSTASVSPAVSITYSPSASFTASPTITITSNLTSTFTPTVTSTSTGVPPTMTFTQTASPTRTSTPSLTITPSRTPVNSATATPTPTLTITLTITAIASPSHTPTLTPYILMTATPTATLPVFVPTKSVFEITDQLLFPNPVNPGFAGNINLSVWITRNATAIKLKIYTPAFRAVREKTWFGNFIAGRVDNTMYAVELSGLASGLYYYYVEGQGENGVKAKSSPGMFVILKQ